MVTPAGRETDIKLDEHGRLEEVKDVYGGTTTHAYYDGSGDFDRTTGRLFLYDIDTGEHASATAESGGKPLGQPIESGLYSILDHPRADFFRLDHCDSNPFDDVHEPTGRDEFRLHKPGATVGCIAIEDEGKWRKIRILFARRSRKTPYLIIRTIHGGFDLNNG